MELEKKNKENKTKLPKFNNLTVAEKQELLNQLKQDVAKLQNRIQEKQEIINELNKIIY